MRHRGLQFEFVTEYRRPVVGHGTGGADVVRVYTVDCRFLPFTQILTKNEMKKARAFAKEQGWLR